MPKNRIRREPGVRNPGLRRRTDMTNGTRPLTTCPACASRLIYPVSFASHPDRERVVIERCCPECDHSDCVVCDAVAAAVWGRRERSIRRELVRQVIALELDEILASV